MFFYADFLRFVQGSMKFPGLSRNFFRGNFFSRVFQGFQGSLATLLTILTGKIQYFGTICSIQYKDGCLAAFNLFHMCLQNQLSSTLSISCIKEYRCLKNVIHQIDSKNEWFLLLESLRQYLDWFLS